MRWCSDWGGMAWHGRNSVFCSCGLFTFGSQMDCGHIFHYRCVRRLLETRWNGPRITFGFCECPICRVSWVKSKAAVLSDLLKPIGALYDQVSGGRRSVGKF